LDVAIIMAAFAVGFLAARVGLPPLVGYLIAGFGLHAFGVAPSTTIDTVAEIGVLLLLFGIGLKLKLKTLARPEVWGGATIHLILTTGFIGGVLMLLGAVGVALADTLTPGEAILLGFALSFSSTVFAVKALEDRNETASLSGRIAIGILIMQDVFAVLFLTASGGTLPSPWAIAVVVGILAARPLIGWLLSNSGHGELVDLLAFSLAIGIGAGGFELVGLKPDLGALFIGIVLANHPKAPEVAERILGYKDILLVGFFLSIGLDGTPTGAALMMAVIALVLVPAKTAGFLILLSRFRLRSRTSLHTSFTLANYSEFGLIVAAVGVDEGLLADEWLGVIAVAVALSFTAAAPTNTARYRIYDRWSDALARLERHPLRPEDAVIDPGAARIIIFGMGRVGAGAYDQFVQRCGQVLVGVDRRDETVEDNVAAGRRVIRGDALDADFWERVRLHSDIQLVVLAMNDHRANLEAARRVQLELPDVRMAATATRADEVEELELAGVDVARNLYGEAGQGLADDATDLLGIG
jgi:glutathione-regulated potassium-efflux system ancillary protein KefC